MRDTVHHRLLIVTARGIIIIIILVITTVAGSFWRTHETTAASVERCHVIQVPMVMVAGQVAELERPLLEQATRLELLIRLHSRTHNLLSLARLLLTLSTSTTATTMQVVVMVLMILQVQWTGHRVQQLLLVMV